MRNDTRPASASRASRCTHGLKVWKEAINNAVQQLQWHSRWLEASSKGRELFLIVSDAVLHRCCKGVEHTFILEDDQNTNFNLIMHSVWSFSTIWYKVIWVAKQLISQNSCLCSKRTSFVLDFVRQDCKKIAKSRPLSSSSSFPLLSFYTTVVSISTTAVVLRWKGKMLELNLIGIWHSDDHSFLSFPFPFAKNFQSLLFLSKD